MTTNTVEQAASLIQQGNLREAQKILEVLLASDVHNLAAWSWYVKSHPAGEKRIKALELCYQNNPENEQVKQALEKMRNNANGPASVEKPDPASMRKSFLLDLFLSTVYCVVIVSFAFAVHNILDYLQHVEERSGNLGFAGFMVYGVVGIFVVFGWVAIGILSSAVMAIRKKKFWLTMTLTGFGVLGGIIFAGYPFLAVLYNPEIHLGSGELGVLGAIAPFLFAFGLATGLGVSTLLVFVLDVITFIPRALLKYHAPL